MGGLSRGVEEGNGIQNIPFYSLLSAAGAKNFSLR
jgi:hypothetical protein